MNAPLQQDIDQPTILVNIGSDDPTRGDAAGWRGLAREVAKRTGALVLYADTSRFTTSIEFGITSAPASMDKGTDSADYQKQLAAHLAPYNPPQIVFGHKCDAAMTAIGHVPDDVHYVTSDNESLASELLNEDELVSHHLTKEDIEAHGKEFDRRHPDMKKPIIALFLVDPYGDENRESFCERMAKVIRHYPEATIYLCASRRTEQSNYDALMEKMKEKLIQHGVNTPEKTRVDVTGYAFDRKAEYNPYKGLIARAKHFVVWGNSQSMMSEALFSGKTVYLAHYGHADKLKKKGCVHQFNELALDAPPLSKSFEPINLTEKIAEKLVDKIAAESKARGKRYDNMSRGLPTAQRNLIDAIRINFRSASRAPDDLKKDRRFVETAVSVRGFALQFFPAFRNDPEVVRRAISQNTDACRFMGGGIRDNTSFAMNMVSQNRPHFHEHVSDRLKDDFEFMVFCAKYSDRAFKSASERLRKNPEFVLELVNGGHISARSLTPEAMADPAVAVKIIAKLPEAIKLVTHMDLDYAKALIDANPICYRLLSADYKDIPSVSEYAISANAENYEFAPESIKERDDITVSALERAPRMLGFAPDRYRDDKTYAMTALKVHANAILTLSERLQSDIEIVSLAMDKDPRHFQYAKGAAKDNADLALRALKHDNYYVEYAGESLRQSPEFWAKALVYTNDPQNLYAFIPRTTNAHKTIVDSLSTSAPRFFAECLSGRNSYGLTAEWEAHRADPALVRIGARYNDLCYVYAQGEAKKDIDLAVDVLADSPSKMHYADPSIQNDPGLWLRVAQKSNFPHSVYEYLPAELRTNVDIAAALLANSPDMAATVLKGFKNDTGLIPALLEAAPIKPLDPFNIPQKGFEGLIAAIIAVRPEWADIIQAAPQPASNTAASFSDAVKSYLGKPALKSLSSIFSSAMEKKFFEPAPIKNINMYTHTSGHHTPVKAPLHAPDSVEWQVNKIMKNFEEDMGVAIDQQPAPVLIREQQLYVWKTNGPKTSIKPDGKGGVDYHLPDGEISPYPDAIISQPKGDHDGLVGVYAPPKQDADAVTMDWQGKSYVCLYTINKHLTAEVDGKIVIGVQSDQLPKSMSYVQPVVYEGAVLVGPQGSDKICGLYVPVNPQTGGPDIKVSFASKADLAKIYGGYTTIPGKHFGNKGY